MAMGTITVLAVSHVSLLIKCSLGPDEKDCVFFSLFLQIEEVENELAKYNS